MGEFDGLPQACRDYNCIVVDHDTPNGVEYRHNYGGSFRDDVTCRTFSPAASPALVTAWLASLHAAPALAEFVNGIETDVQRTLASALARSQTWDHVLVLFQERVNGAEVAVGSTADGALTANDAIAMCERAKFSAIVDSRLRGEEE